MLSEENVSIQISGEGRLKTELTNKDLHYPATIEVNFSELNASINEFSLHAEFFGWDSFKPQDFKFEADPDDAVGIAQFALAPIQLQEERTFTLKHDEPLQISVFLRLIRSIIVSVVPMVFVTLNPSLL